MSCVPAVMLVFCTTADNADSSVYKAKSTAKVGTRGSQKVLGNPLLTENERYDNAYSDMVVSLACLLAVATGLVRFQRAVLLLCRFS